MILVGAHGFGVLPKPVSATPRRPRTELPGRPVQERGLEAALGGVAGALVL